MSKIFAGCIFFNELDVLKIYLEELYQVVDQFIIVESNKTFRGRPKPYYYRENSYLFEKYNDKITNICLRDPDNFSQNYQLAPWQREAWQRNSIVDGFTGHDKDDILIFGDVDEIPRRELISRLNPEPFIAIQMNGYVYRLNIYGCHHFGTKAVRRHALQPLETLRYIPPDVFVENGGWHFSSLGTAEHISEKFQAFSHWEIDKNEYTSPKNIQKRIDTLADPIDRGFLTRVEVDETWPEEIKNNLEYWNKWIV